MAVPRHHMAKGKQLRRRSHLALKPLKLNECPQCKKAVLPHIVCKNCGYYRGKEIINVLAKELKKQDKIKKRQK
ncbi:MAG: 50S ribosomal protein L32 [Candidatus Yanofskybacteria bacterium RIFCSPHIGHO2_02_FULL_39_10]|uniref:Large ribosomal subunit protein bL32 n=1 Tax=Candidatus Yanofskybacteria bacterium RIFCSPHIGHO2_02_FULL_39_10 TaxID=1802674 RepID=A0A1F8F4M7_9BACT|nr:MAG: 50S ribosomal protein L32 [Candidatus Yanofskybacteria bacterium RIFCSPHIGHO2_02_FULL_39_10]